MDNGDNTKAKLSTLTNKKLKYKTFEILSRFTKSRRIH